MRFFLKSSQNNMNFSFYYRTRNPCIYGAHFCSRAPRLYVTHESVGKEKFESLVSALKRVHDGLLCRNIKIVAAAATIAHAANAVVRSSTDTHNGPTYYLFWFFYGQRWLLRCSLYEFALSGRFYVFHAISTNNIFF